MDLNPSNRDTAKYTAWYASGTAPDVVCGDNFIWSKFYNANAILEISDYLKRDKIDLKEQAAKLTWQEVPAPGKGGRKLPFGMPKF